MMGEYFGYNQIVIVEEDIHKTRFDVMSQLKLTNVK